MSSALFAQMHGGTTHFPIALVIASVTFDLAAAVLRDTGHRRDLRAAGFFALLLGAAASFAAVLTGLLLTRGDVIGSGSLARHHLFLWPGFALIVGLAVWRLMVHDDAGRRAQTLYLILMLATSGLVAAAGYWGGEILLADG